MGRSLITGPWAAGSPLDSKVHRRLVEDSAYYATLAGIREAWLWQPLESHVSANELKWVISYRTLDKKGKRGLVYLGRADRAATHMQAICGALVRNFVDARVRGFEEVLASGPGNSPLTCSVLLIPDLCVGKDKPVAWAVNTMTRILIRRDSLGLQTLLYGYDRTTLRAAFGATFADMLDPQRYMDVTV